MENCEEKSRSVKVGFCQQKREKLAVKSEFRQNNPRITATTTDLGIGLNAKIVLNLGRFGKSEEWS
ncbi:hypothetical protein IWX80_002830 [Flavobacterium sp. CAN_S2]